MVLDQDPAAQIQKLKPPVPRDTSIPNTAPTSPHGNLPAQLVKPPTPPSNRAAHPEVAIDRLDATPGQPNSRARSTSAY